MSGGREGEVYERKRVKKKMHETRNKERVKVEKHEEKGQEEGVR